VYPSSDVVEFGGFVLAHCAAIAATNEPGDLICPFAIVAKGENRQVIDFESETQQEAVQKGWASLDEWREHIDAWGFGREGLLSDGSSHKVDVLCVSVWKPGMSEAVNLFQRFTPTLAGAFFLFGPVEFSINGRAPDASTATKLQSWLMTGILRHPHGAKWTQWLRQ
jgi:hypothetical protein